MRQRIRNLITLIAFLSFPLIFNYFSPYLSAEGAFRGIVSGSLALFIILFLLSLVLGRAFCGWLCPVGCFQDICMVINNTRRSKNHWIKYVIWFPWFGSIVFGLAKAGGPIAVDPFYMTESGISITEPLQFVTYYFVLLVFLILALAVGRHAFCHYGCWIAPYLIFGRKLRNLIGLPSLQLKAKPARCIECGTCTNNCLMSIDVQARVKQDHMEHSDCILCGRCVDNCAQDVIAYTFAPPKKNARNH